MCIRDRHRTVLLPPSKKKTFLRNPKLWIVISNQLFRESRGLNLIYITQKNMTYQGYLPQGPKNHRNCRKLSDFRHLSRSYSFEMVIKSNQLYGTVQGTRHNLYPSKKYDQPVLPIAEPYKMIRRDRIYQNFRYFLKAYGLKVTIKSNQWTTSVWKTWMKLFYWR